MRACRCALTIVLGMLSLGAGLGCGGGSNAPIARNAASPPSAPSCDHYDYRFELDAQGLLTTTLCFDGAPPRALVCGPQGDRNYAPTSERLTGATIEPIAASACRISLETLEVGDCVRYVVDLRQTRTPGPLGYALP